MPDTEDLVSIVVPVYNEDRSIVACIEGLTRALAGLPHEILICHDMPEDRTLAALAAMPNRPAGVRSVLNEYGRGAAHALRSGFKAAQGDVVVVTMADLSDPPGVIPAMVEKIRRGGADVVSGSRYMRGGSQTGGPRFKGLLSRLAGASLHYLAGMQTHDATNNFRAYRRDFLRAVEVQSLHGFEVALELTVKAHVGGWRVDEVPSTWQDRTAGESRFRLWKWMPRYLRWYLRAMAGPLLAWAVSALLLACLLALQLPLSRAALAAGSCAVVLTLLLRFARPRPGSGSRG